MYWFRVSSFLSGNANDRSVSKWIVSVFPRSLWECWMHRFRVSLLPCGITDDRCVSECVGSVFYTILCWNTDDCCASKWLGSVLPRAFVGKLMIVVCQNEFNMCFHAPIGECWWSLCNKMCLHVPLWDCWWWLCIWKSWFRVFTFLCGKSDDRCVSKRVVYPTFFCKCQGNVWKKNREPTYNMAAMVI